MYDIIVIIVSILKSILSKFPSKVENIIRESI